MRQQFPKVNDKHIQFPLWRHIYKKNTWHQNLPLSLADSPGLDSPFCSFFYTCFSEKNKTKTKQLLWIPSPWDQSSRHLFFKHLIFFQRAWKVSYESVILFFKHSQLGEAPDLLFKSYCNRTLTRSKLTSKKTLTKSTLKSRIPSFITLNL